MANKRERRWDCEYDEEPITFTAMCGEFEKGTVLVVLQDGALDPVGRPLVDNEDASDVEITLETAPDTQDVAVVEDSNSKGRFLIKPGLDGMRLYAVCTATKSKPGKRLSATFTSRDRNDTDKHICTMEFPDVDAHQTRSFVAIVNLRKEA